jgi:hypothetical protein
VDTDKVFKVSYSTDSGATWVRDPEADSESYMHAYKLCQDRSARLGRLQRISRPDLGVADMVTFKNGVARAGDEMGKNPTV